MVALLSKPPPTLEGLPAEVMSLIMTYSDANGKPILNTQDVFNLRLVSRRIQETSLDAFARRFFTTRKHMLSQPSLQCLRNITTHALLGSYVREISIGPEQINSGFEMFLSNMDPAEQDHWAQTSKPKYEKLVQDQKDFDASGEAFALLATALKAVPKLQHFHFRIDAYPDPKDHHAWSEAWGAKTILREMGLDPYRGPNCPTARYLLVDEISGLLGHCALVLSALCSIKERKEWSLEVNLKSLDLKYAEQPFDLESLEWQAVQDRVRAVGLKRTESPYRYDHVDQRWILQFVQSCLSLESLTLDEQKDCGYLLRFCTLVNLRHLTIRASYAPSAGFRLFLNRHANTLESISCERTHLWDHDTWANFTGWPEDILDGIILVPFDGMDETQTWTSQFEIMVTMPRLKEARFSNLTQAEFENKPSTYNDDTAQGLAGGTSMVATGDDVANKLGQAVKGVVSVRGRRGRAKVWFPDTN